MWGKLTKNWFLLTLAACFLIGFRFAAAIGPAMEWPCFRGGIVFIVMFAMGVTLRADAIGQSLARPIAAAIAIVTNMFVVPLLALPAYWILPANQFGGLFVVALVPCTLASAAVWTRRAGGDDSIALLTTVITNLACVIVIPIGTALVLGRHAGMSLTQQAVNLLVVVVAPLALAQTMRSVTKSGATWVDQRKIAFSVVAQIGILLMVLMGAARCALTIQADADQAGWSALTGMNLLAASISIHVVSLLLAIFAGRHCGIEPAGQIACGFSGSQKTLMVGIQVAMEMGVSVVPMLLYHTIQLVIDTIIAQRWKRQFGDDVKDLE